MEVTSVKHELWLLNSVETQKLKEDIQFGFWRFFLELEMEI